MSAIRDAVAAVLAARADGDFHGACAAEDALTDLVLRAGQFEPDRMIEALLCAGEINTGPVASEVLAVERIHEWVYADDDRQVIIERGDADDILVTFSGDGGSYDSDPILANAVLGVETIEEADDAR